MQQKTQEPTFAYANREPANLSTTAAAEMGNNEGRDKYKTSKANET
jgi:hypothetical protein